MVTIIFLFSTALFLAACGDEVKQNEDNEMVEENQSAKDQDGSRKSGSPDKIDENYKSKSESKHVKSDSSNKVSSKENNETPNEENNRLSDYSLEEIEYARIWLQLGVNQEVDGIYVDHISVGEPLNSDDESTVGYPEDVIQLSGTRLIDGSITYSSNGDGTINVYNVPKRWDGKNPAGEEFYKKIIEDTRRIPVDPGEKEQVYELI